MLKEILTLIKENVLKQERTKSKSLRLPRITDLKSCNNNSYPLANYLLIYNPLIINLNTYII